MPDQASASTGRTSLFHAWLLMEMCWRSSVVWLEDSRAAGHPPCRVAECNTIAISAGGVVDLGMAEVAKSPGPAQFFWRLCLLGLPGRGVAANHLLLPGLQNEPRVSCGPEGVGQQLFSGLPSLMRCTSS